MTGRYPKRRPRMTCSTEANNPSMETHIPNPFIHPRRFAVVHRSHAWIPLLLTGLCLVTACGDKPETDPAQERPAARTDIPVSEIVATGKVEPAREIVSLAAPVGGIVSGVPVRDGEAVRKGDVLVQLDDALEQLRIREIDRQLVTQQAQVDIEKAAEDILRTRIEENTREQATARTLAEKGAGTRQSVQDLEFDGAILVADLEKAKAGSRYAKSRLEELRQQRLQAVTAARDKRLRAPDDGMILDMAVQPGAAIAPFQAYADFAPAGPLVVRAEVDELFSQRVKPGQSVEIRYTGFTDVVATGQVESLASYLRRKSLFSIKAGDQEDRRVREVRITLHGDPDLLIDARVECIIKT